MAILTGEIELSGFSVIDAHLDRANIERLIQDITALDFPPTQAGIRNLLELLPSIRTLAQSPEIRSVVEPILGDSPGERLRQRVHVVRGIFFDKQPHANWKVPWHQDLTIAVKNRLEVPDFHPWSVKAEIHHVQPPVAILEQMLTVRIHLVRVASALPNRTDESNGALKVIPGSHTQGRLTAPDIDLWKQSPAISCNCQAGGILLMRPLLLHASSIATTPSHRRVIHLEYASCPLPSGLEWYYSDLQEENGVKRQW
ncbi:phytanoyl-CoA dioxygenase family protein [Chamaesiphon sp. GL140_3_metabinner_50]|uniref:phytanoyl-CoA dioxygenase family protein n=1 Tax=Chamaesiphon sp. GL140_3_metabinner_50 TaxID=2970812 RepID=UPI0025F95BBD|nr:phytanoyl-CoA dioxygenase family protein [Chamaesiphon sp. GL140_3_metabinner_50]